MEITSTKNSLVREIRQLRTKQYREATGRCIVEGIQPVLRAIDNNIPLEMLIYAPELLTSETAKAALARACRDGERCVTVTADVFRHFSERDNPVGLAAIARPRLTELADLKLNQSAILTALYRVNNPGNLGTIVRTIDSIAGAGLVLLGPTADPFDPSCIKASVGTVFNVPIVLIPQAEDFLAWCKQNSVQLITTSSSADFSLLQARFSYPCAFLLGSEGQGLPPQLLGAGDLAISIPMYGQASSLNLAVACGITLHAARALSPLEA